MPATSRRSTLFARVHAGKSSSLEWSTRVATQAAHSLELDGVRDEVAARRLARHAFVHMRAHDLPQHNRCCLLALHLLPTV